MLNRCHAMRNAIHQKTAFSVDRFIDLKNCVLYVYRQSQNLRQHQNLHIFTLATYDSNLTFSRLLAMSTSQGGYMRRKATPPNKTFFYRRWSANEEVSLAEQLVTIIQQRKQIFFNYRKEEATDTKISIPKRKEIATDAITDIKAIVGYAFDSIMRFRRQNGIFRYIFKNCELKPL